MKQLATGTKVKVLYGAGDNAPDWVPATVIGAVTPQAGFERHGAYHGNVVKLENKERIVITEPGFIAEL